MQTFLPYPNFRKSLECLDNKRLGKQRVETMQLINAIEKHTLLPKQKTAWFHHPACQQWVGYLEALKIYHDMSILVWKERGFKNTMKFYFHDEPTLHIEELARNYHGGLKLPPWLGNEAYHASHRSNLLRKDPIHYGQFGWTEPDNLPYVWPSKDL